MEAVSILMGYAATRDVIEEIVGSNVFRILRRLVEHHLLFIQQVEGGRAYLQHDIVREARSVRSGQSCEQQQDDGLSAEHAETTLPMGNKLSRVARATTAANLPEFRLALIPPSIRVNARGGNLPGGSRPPIVRARVAPLF